MNSMIQSENRFLRLCCFVLTCVGDDIGIERQSVTPGLFIKSSLTLIFVLGSEPWRGEFMKRLKTEKDC